MNEPTDQRSENLLHRRELLMAAALMGATNLLSAQELSAMEKIRARGTLKIAVYKDNAPFSDGPLSDLRGVDVSLAQALSLQLGLKPVFLPFDAGEDMNDDLRNMVWKGHYLGYGPADVMLHVPVDRHLMNENKQVFIFGPYTRQEMVVLHHKSKIAQVQFADDLSGKVVAVEQGSGAASTLMGYRAGLLREKVTLYKDGVAAASATIAGKVDAAYVTRAQAQAALFTASAKGDWVISSLTIPGGVPAGWPLGLAVKSDNKELATALEKALNALRQNGELVRIFQSHGLTLTLS